MGKTIKITGIYRSPQLCQKIFNKNLLDYIENTGECDYHVVVGDMNVNLLSTGELVEEYKNLFSSFGYNSYINDVTRPSSGSCLDHIFLGRRDPTEDKNSAFILRSNITDHCAISLCLDIEKIQAEKAQKYKSYVDYGRLKEDLGRINWDNMIENTNVNSFAEAFIGSLTHYTEKNTTSIRLSCKKSLKKDWITPGLFKAINVKNSSYK